MESSYRMYMLLALVAGATLACASDSDVFSTDVAASVNRKCLCVSSLSEKRCMDPRNRMHETKSAPIKMSTFHSIERPVASQAIF